MQFITNLHKAISLNAKRNAFHINDKTYTYKNLDVEINKIRLKIQQIIPNSEKLIGLVTNDDIETYASIIALWLEGKAYVPINPIYPTNRNNEILNSVEAKFILDSSEESLYNNEYSVLSTNKLDSPENTLAAVKVNADDIAYILFTSGSTGKPKGVPITFSNLNALINAIDADPLFDLISSDRCLQMFELSFDFSLVAYLPPLLAGACIYTIPKNKIKYIYTFKLLMEQKLTVLTMVPSIIQHLQPYYNEINAPWVRYCSFGGGKLLKDIAANWSKCIPKSQIFNYYGPTEFTVYSGYYPYNSTDANKHHKGIIGIGKPLEGVTYLIVNEKNVPVAQGETGELCLAGKQTTIGYWKNDALNEKSFFIIDINGVKMRFYKTGDLCFKDDNDDYMYIGRLDFQVKIGGYRVELGEIEYHVKQVLKNKEIVVLDITNKDDSTELALALVSDEFDLTSLKEYLKEKLPVYMVPTKYKFFDDLPHNINGKIDLNKLRLQY